MTDTRRLRALYICYLSLEDPLVHTQVVAYLRGLAAGGHRIHLLTFETGRLTRQRRRSIHRSLAADGIHWHGLRYHKRPSLPATLYDAAVGALVSSLLVVRYRLDTLHARSHVPAAMALLTRRLVLGRRPALIFDIRGLMAEEYEDAGRWPRDGLAFRLTKRVERAAIRSADGIVVLTERIRRQLFADAPDPRVYVIPCCADLDALGASSGERESARAELGLEGRTVMTYVGKFGGWYMGGEMARFFAVARQSHRDLHFLVLTQSDPDHITHELGRNGVNDAFTITSKPPERLPRYLAAADFGIGFIRPSPSKRSSSPTKIGEYLGAGLPVLCTAGVGDLDTLITPEVGALVDEHSDRAYTAAAAAVMQLVGDADTRRRCHELAERELSLADVGIPRYLELYGQVGECLSGSVEASSVASELVGSRAAQGEARPS